MTREKTSCPLPVGAKEKERRARLGHAKEMNVGLKAPPEAIGHAMHQKVNIGALGLVGLVDHL